MNRFIPLLLLLTLTAGLLSGCRKSEPDAESTPASVSHVYTTAAPEPETTPAPAEPENLPLIETEADIPESGFPGGLDDDGREPGEADEPDPVEVVAMTRDQQRTANVFLSNFVEQYFGDFSYTQEDVVARTVDFAHMWTKINDYGSIRYENTGGESYEVMSLDQAAAVVSRYFPADLTLADPEGLVLADGHGFYRDGSFYYEAADGDAHAQFAVVTTLVRLSDGTVAMEFDIYEMDLEEYFNNGFDTDNYRLTPEEAAADSSLTLQGGGTARAIPGTWNGRDAYFLLEYNHWYF